MLIIDLNVSDHKASSGTAVTKSPTDANINFEANSGKYLSILFKFFLRVHFLYSTRSGHVKTADSSNIT